MEAGYAELQTLGMHRSQLAPFLQMQRCWTLVVCQRQGHQPL